MAVRLVYAIEKVHVAKISKVISFAPHMLEVSGHELGVVFLKKKEKRKYSVNPHLFCKSFAFSILRTIQATQYKQTTGDFLKEIFLNQAEAFHTNHFDSLQEIAFFEQL